MISRKTVVISLLGIGLLVLIVVAFLPQPVMVDALEVRRGLLEVVVEEEGRTRVRDRYTISMPVTGYLERVALEPGDPVAAGQVLASVVSAPSEVLDPRRRAQAQAEVAAARAALRSAEHRFQMQAAEAQLAASEFERQQRLFAQETISRAELDRAQTQARRFAEARDEAAANVEIAEEQLRQAQTALAFAGVADPDEAVPVSSPVTGQVLARHRESEGVVPAGTALLDVGDVSRLEVATDVLSRDAVRIRPGQEVRFARWGGDAELRGRVIRVEPGGFTRVSALGVEEQRVWVISEIVDDPALWQGLGDGYRVESRFVLWADDDVLQVPTGALFRYEGEWAAFRVVNGRAQRVPVVLGQRSATHAQVIDGLAAGDLVVAHPPDGLEDGGRVEPAGG